MIKEMIAESYYKLIWRDNLVENSYVADEWNLPEKTIEQMLNIGIVNSWPQNAWMRASTTEMDGDLDDFVVNNAIIPVVTVRLRKLIDSLNTTPIEWLPIAIQDSKGGKHSCFVLNTKEHVKGAVDVKRSDVLSSYPKNCEPKEARGKLQAVIKICLRLNRVSGLDLFRAAEYPGGLLASERFRNEFQRRRFTGVGFQSTVVV